MTYATNPERYTCICMTCGRVTPGNQRCACMCPACGSAPGCCRCAALAAGAQKAKAAADG